MCGFGQRESEVVNTMKFNTVAKCKQSAFRCWRRHSTSVRGASSSFRETGICFFDCTVSGNCDRSSRYVLCTFSYQHLMDTNRSIFDML
jgi:hypothetical protein